MPGDAFHLHLPPETSKLSFPRQQISWPLICFDGALFSTNLTLEGLPSAEIVVGGILTTEDKFQGKEYRDHGNSQIGASVLWV